MRRGVTMPVVERVIRRQPKAQLVAAARADFESGRVRIVKPPKEVWPDPGGVDWAFQDAKRKRA